MLNLFLIIPGYTSRFISLPSPPGVIMQRTDQEIASSIQPLITRLTNAFIGLAGFKQEVINEIFFLNELFHSKTQDFRMPATNPVGVDLKVMATQTAPFCENKELAEEVSYFINHFVENVSRSHPQLFNTWIRKVEMLAKRFKVDLNHTHILNWFLSANLSVYLKTHNIHELNIQDLIDTVAPYCQRNNFPLQRVRFNVWPHAILAHITFLHLAIFLGKAEMVKSFIDAPTDAWNYIPSTIWHPSSNTALHYCTLCAPAGNAPADDPKVNPFILIANYLSDPKRVDHLELNIHELAKNGQLHHDGGTPLTGAAMNGSVALAKLLVERSPHATQQCWLIGRNDRLTPFDFANTPELMGYFRSLPGHPADRAQVKAMQPPPARPQPPKQAQAPSGQQRQLAPKAAAVFGPSGQPVNAFAKGAAAAQPSIPTARPTAATPSSGAAIAPPPLAKPVAPPQPSGAATMQPSLATLAATTFLQPTQGSATASAPAPSAPPDAAEVKGNKRKKGPEKPTAPKSKKGGKQAKDADETSVEVESDDARSDDTRLNERDSAAVALKTLSGYHKR